MAGAVERTGSSVDANADCGPYVAANCDGDGGATADGVGNPTVANPPRCSMPVGTNVGEALRERSVSATDGFAEGARARSVSATDKVGAPGGILRSGGNDGGNTVPTSRSVTFAGSITTDHLPSGAWNR